jgi:hypothetical protein
MQNQIISSISFIKKDGGLPIDSKVLTPRAVVKRRQDKVVDSKMVTPAMKRNADASKGSRRGAAAIATTVCG